MKKFMKGIIIVMALVILVGVSWGKPIKKENVMVENDTSWNWHSDGEFKYPSTYKRSKLWVDDVPAYVEIFSDGKILLCYWPLLGAWSTQIDFPEEGVWLSPTEIVLTKCQTPCEREQIKDMNENTIKMFFDSKNN